MKFDAFDTTAPANIVLLKSHSLGVGDVLRSSAAWASLKQKWPSARLHLVFLSRHPGYSTEVLIQHHHLLAGAYFVTIKFPGPKRGDFESVPWSQVKSELCAIARQVKPDLIIDFEPHGLRTTMAARWLQQHSRAVSVGIEQFPGRGLFYDVSAPSVRQYQRVHGLKKPMDYTEKDYVVLAALGISRNGQAIELRLSPAGLRKREQVLEHLRQADTALPVVGLNIGCGTEGALTRRPVLEDLAEALADLSRRIAFRLVLTGAAFEQVVNQAFVDLLNHRLSKSLPVVVIPDTQDLLELAGVIDVCDVFISSDSGPYHMSVALGKPTYLWLQYLEQTAIHPSHRVVYAVKPQAQAFSESVLRLLDGSNAPSLKSDA